MKTDSSLGMSNTLILLMRSINLYISLEHLITSQKMILTVPDHSFVSKFFKKM